MNDHNSVETRLRGALREIADHAPPAPALDSRMPRTEHSESHQTKGWLRPVLAAAAVAAIVGGAGTVVAGQILDAPGREDSTMVGPAEPGGTIPPNEVSDPPTASEQAVDDVAAQLTAFEATPGYGRVSVDYATAEVTVLWKGEPPADVKALAEADPNGVDVIIEQTRYSEAELVQAARQILSAPKNEVAGATVAAALPNEDLSGLIVEIVEPWSGSTAPLEEVAQVPVTVRLVEQAPQPLGDK
jgi:hypothetical protein